SILRAHYQQRFVHLLVDEFQDTNPLQYAWLTLLAGDKGRIFVVGDDDQSIYAFRGADVSNMYDLEQDYAQHNIILIKQNYCTSRKILDAANDLIVSNLTRLRKNLWTEAVKGNLIQVQAQDTDSLEAQWVVDKIQLLIESGFEPAENAVLYRSNAQSR